MSKSGKDLKSSSHTGSTTESKRTAASNMPGNLSLILIIIIIIKYRYTANNNESGVYDFVIFNLRVIIDAET